MATAISGLRPLDPAPRHPPRRGIADVCTVVEAHGIEPVNIAGRFRYHGVFPGSAQACTHSGVVAGGRIDLGQPIRLDGLCGDVAGQPGASLIDINVILF